MTRKVTLSIGLILLIFICYLVIFSNNSAFRSKVASVSQLESSSKELNTAVATLEKNRTTDFEDKKKELEKAIKSYQESKEEYETVVAQAVNTENVAVEDISETENVEEVLEAIQTKDVYNVDFLWTILGNYATEEGIDLKFDINKNMTSVSSMNNTSSNYIVCDLNFTISGNYINLTDFIYDIEDDDRLNFEINDFYMQKDGSNLQVTLVVKEIKINADTLIDSSSNAVSTTDNISTDVTQDNSNQATNTTANTTTDDNQQVINDMTSMEVN